MNAGPHTCGFRNACIQPARIAALTPRERDVLAGIVAGCSNKVIAHELGISPRTVEVHRANIMRDLGARHIAHVVCATIEAIRLGLYLNPPSAFMPLLAHLFQEAPLTEMAQAKIAAE